MYLRDPAFASLDGKESEHGVETVIIVEILPSPDPAHKKQDVNKLFSLKEHPCTFRLNLQYVFALKTEVRKCYTVVYLKA
jgi:hypothetical protein